MGVGAAQLLRWTSPPHPRNPHVTMESKTNTIGYQLIRPQVKIEGLSLLESMPPQCMLNFSTIVYWRGHTLAAEAKHNGETIDVYVTLTVPPPGPMKGTPLSGAINLGALTPGEYDVNVHFRKLGYGSESDDFRRDASLSLLAQAATPPIITPERSRDWSAWVNAMPGIGATPTLHVVGTLTGAAGLRASLIRAIPQGFNPNILLLRLVTTPDPDAPDEQAVRYSEGAPVGTFSSLTILFPNGGAIDIGEITVAV